MRIAVRGVLLAAVLVLGLPAAAQAVERPSPFPFHWGKIRSASGHSGHARVDAWVTAFNEKHFQTYGSLYDRDRHAGHCASVQARFHYSDSRGGTGRSKPRRACGPEKKGFLFESARPVKWLDLKVCVYRPAGGTVAHCRTERIRDEDFAW
ncbi:hypothetical protein ACFOWE_20435 [Planomonospora corallina]|uniref:Secreted protein n=1 Tax=Planomonospora corallina TaxID=1806052 RepID=A0ABV8I9E6_9ACTN